MPKGTGSSRTSSASTANGVVARSLTQALAEAFLVVGLTALNRVMAMASLTVRMRLRENTQLYLDTYLMGLTVGVPGIAHHELPTYLDRVELLRNGRNELANPFNPISWTLASLLQIASATLLLAGVDPLLALVPLAGAPAAYLSVRTQQHTSAQLEEQAEDNRVLRHLFELATTPGPAKEIRLYALGDELLDRHRAQFDRLERDRVALARRLLAMTSAAWLFFALAYCVALAETVRLAQDGRATIGAVVLVLGIGVQLSAQLNELAFCIAWFVRTHRAVSRLVWFEDYAYGARGSAPGRPGAGAGPPRARHRARRSDLRLRQGRPAARTRRAGARRRRPRPPRREDDRDRRRERRRQDDPREAAGAPLRADRGARPRRRDRPAAVRRRRLAPTASLDAPTEHSLFERFAAAAHDAGTGAGAITILVSHRFSTVRMADLILVVSDGRISEAGTHDGLLELGGLYAELYELRASSYR